MNAPGQPGKAGTWLMVAAGVVVAGAVVAALFVMDPPARQRAERLDGIRVHQLQVLAWRIDAHAGVHGALPEDLAAIDRSPGEAIADPVTGEPYTYEPTGERSYRLCATFGTATATPHSGPPGVDEWRHGEGRQCFDREVRDGNGVPVPAKR